jgi:drug/metabolite transporter (DMT)-like permease
MKAVFYTGFALVAFACNSIFCRLALGLDLIDAASFTAVRILSGAAALFIIFSIFGKKNDAESRKGNWLSAFFLFLYAVCFSFAYNGLSTGTGALILFGSVQATMIGAAIFKGERPTPAEWLGLFIAVGGLVYLVLPGLSAPPFFSSALMALAGAAWGFYTLRGRKSADPLADTAGNFIRAVPFAALLAFAPFVAGMRISGSGLLLAALSGVVASGIGYAVWYAALKFHTATRAAVLQLSVPVLAAAGGIVFLSETVTSRLLISAVLVLGGIGAAVAAKRKKISEK